jgi:hypothetical protein
VGRASRSKRRKEATGSGGGDSGPSGLGKATLFTDVHPQQRINARFFIQMFEMLSETTLSLDEQQQVIAPIAATRGEQARDDTAALDPAALRRACRNSGGGARNAGIRTGQPAGSVTSLTARRD